MFCHKYSAEQKIKACEDYLSGKFTAREVCERHGIHYDPQKRSDAALRQWVSKYKLKGAIAFSDNHSITKSYSSIIKISAVEDYLAGNGSLSDITAKYDISSTTVLRRWIKKYNANIELKDYDPKREVYMAEARRKTTIEERKEIVEYCIEHGRDYKGTAALYDVSYTQVYSWVRKYDAGGEAALVDKRGHHKTDTEVDELERLRRENLRLKRQLQERDMTVELLKKVRELEGM